MNCRNPTVRVWLDACVLERDASIEKRFVYIVRSDSDPSRHYVGITRDIAERLEWHNHGPSGYTVDNRPWSVVVSIEFRNERDAVGFEGP